MRKKKITSRWLLWITGAPVGIFRRSGSNSFKLHRAGFRRYWRWKSQSLGGRTQISAELRALIRRMSIENLLWGAPRIHGELLKLGFAVAQSTVAKYMAKNGDPCGQRWST